MTQTIPDTDPLEAYESVPAVSFHEPNGGYAKGKWAKLTVRDWPQLVQQRDDDGNPEFWESTRPGEEPQPKLVLVVAVTDEEGVDKNLWAKKMGKKWPDSLYQQLIKAQKDLKAETGDATRRLRPGDVLAVVYAEDDTSKPKVKGNYPKKYKAKIKPGTYTPPPPADALAEESDDPWSSTPTAEAPRQPGGDPFGAATPDEGDEPPF